MISRKHIQKFKHFYKNRTPLINKEIKETFTFVNKTEKILYKTFGNTKYNLFFNHDKHLEHLLYNNLGKTIFVIDVGAGSGLFCDERLNYINNKNLRANKITENTTFVFISLTGEQQLFDEDDDDEYYDDYYDSDYESSRWSRMRREKRRELSMLKPYIKLGNNCMHIFLMSFKLEDILNSFSNLNLDKIKFDVSYIEEDKKVDILEYSAYVNDAKRYIKNLKNNVSWIVSSWCLFHLIDPIGFIEQCLELLQIDGCMEVNKVIMSNVRNNLSEKQLIRMNELDRIIKSLPKEYETHKTDKKSKKTLILEESHELYVEKAKKCNLTLLQFLTSLGLNFLFIPNIWWLLEKDISFVDALGGSFLIQKNKPYNNIADFVEYTDISEKSFAKHSESSCNDIVYDIKVAEEQTTHLINVLDVYNELFPKYEETICIVNDPKFLQIFKTCFNIDFKTLNVNNFDVDSFAEDTSSKSLKK